MWYTRVVEQVRHRSKRKKAHACVMGTYNNNIIPLYTAKYAYITNIWTTSAALSTNGQ